jgi:hypothetical protein
MGFHEPIELTPPPFDGQKGYRQGESRKMNFSSILNPQEKHFDQRNTYFGVKVLESAYD